MKEFEPLSNTEMAAVKKVCDLFHEANLIPCTACRYCILDNDCPRHILIPDLEVFDQ